MDESTALGIAFNSLCACGVHVLANKANQGPPKATRMGALSVCLSLSLSLSLSQSLCLFKLFLLYVVCLFCCCCLIILETVVCPCFMLQAFCVPCYGKSSIFQVFSRPGFFNMPCFIRNTFSVCLIRSTCPCFRFQVFCVRGCTDVVVVLLFFS